MATPPFSDSLLAKLSSRTQSAKQFLTLKEVRNFQAYCCNINSNGIMGVAKDPVIVVSIEPEPVCLGSPITWNISGSYAPGSTLTAWSIDFGDGSVPIEGVDFPNDTTSGEYTYQYLPQENPDITIPEEQDYYEITINIEEGGGRSQELIQNSSVIDCTEELDYAYISTYGNGVYYVDFANPEDEMVGPQWETANTGLSGNALKVNSLLQLRETKELKREQHKLWIATDDGVYKTSNGGLGWQKMNMPDPDLDAYEAAAFFTVSASSLVWLDVKRGNKDGTIYIIAAKIPE